MTQSRPSLLRRALLASAAAFVVTAAPLAAEAAPYAFASNQITSLTVTYVGGASILPGLVSATQNISASANYPGPNTGPLAAGGPVGSALNLPAPGQAFAGPGPMPGDNVFIPAGPPGTFIGTRADAFISGGNASAGGVSVSNVAEGYSNAAPGTFGTSTANNTANITFTVQGTGQALEVSFTNLIQLIAQTDPALGETASARIANTFGVFRSDGTLIAEFAPGEINRQVGSGAGNPPIASIGPTSFNITLTTPVLENGVIYNLSLTSSATESIFVGRAVPEPASLALLGAGLLGLAAVRFRRNG